jgi:hypothetical protein
MGDIVFMLELKAIRLKAEEIWFSVKRVVLGISIDGYNPAVEGSSQIIN